MARFFFCRKKSEEILQQGSYRKWASTSCKYGVINPYRVITPVTHLEGHFTHLAGVVALG